MLHSALQRLPRLPALSHRTFVSSVLLTKTWENEPVSALRNEAKTRSLSPKGNKSTLISRILAHEKHIASQGIPLLTLSRSASMASISPGIPPPSQPAGTLPEDFFHINLPDLSQRDSGPETQVPYVPDFWDSKPAKTVQAVDPPLPKLLIVAGADTHHGGGPLHNLHDEHSHATYLTDSHIVPLPTTTSPHTTGGLFHDIAEDIGIPTTLNMNEVQKTIANLLARNDRYISQRRKLDEDEARGVWVLLGLLAGSYLLAGLVNGKPALQKDKKA